MSGIQFNTVSFRGTAVTDDGNEYNKTHLGKIGATLVAAGGSGAYSYYQGDKVKKAVQNKTQVGKDFLTALEETPALKDLRKQLEEKKITIKEFREQRSALAKNGMKLGFTGFIAGATIVGLAIGAIIDHYVNKSRAEKADKIA